MTRINRLNQVEIDKCKDIYEMIEKLFQRNKILSNCEFVGKKEKTIWVVPIEVKNEIIEYVKNIT